MRLSDRDIKRYIDKGRLVIDPLNEDYVQPASVDLTLGSEFYIPIPSSIPINSLKPDLENRVRYADSIDMLLHPNQFIIATTVETIELDSGIQGQIDGKSKYARMGLTIHQTGGFIDPGFHGKIVLEISNVSPWPIRLHKDMPICQISFTELATPAERPYGSEGLNSHYQGQTGATLPRF